MPCFHNHNYSLFALKITTRMCQQAAFFQNFPGEHPQTPCFGYGLTTLKLLPLTLKSAAEEWLEMTLITLSTAMTHHKTSGPLYHHFLSNGLVWVKSMASLVVAVGGAKGNYILLNNAYTSVIHGISTFLVICYAMCIKVSLYLLVPMWLRKTGFKPPALLLAYPLETK